MDKKKDIIRKLSKFKSKVNKDMPLQKVIFFGSMASGKPHKWSDVDLIIVSAGFKKKNIFKRGAKLYDYWDLNLPVDFLCYTPEEFEKKKKQIGIIKTAVEEGIEI